MLASFPSQHGESHPPPFGNPPQRLCLISSRSSEQFLQRSHARWVSKREADEFLLALCLRFAKLGKMEDNHFLQKQKGNIGLLVNDARNWHIKTIENNHGVKESNLQALFVPYGDSVWNLVSPLTTWLEPYAVLRGKYAHTSASNVTVPDPDDEHSEITNLLGEIRPVDEALQVVLARL
jgi:hypothetical protein